MFSYSTPDEALEGAIYALTEARKRPELPSWLQQRLGDEVERLRLFARVIAHNRQRENTSEFAAHDEHLRPQ